MKKMTFDLTTTTTTTTTTTANVIQMRTNRSSSVLYQFLFSSSSSSSSSSKQEQLLKVHPHQRQRFYTTTLTKPTTPTTTTTEKKTTKTTTTKKTTKATTNESIKKKIDEINTCTSITALDTNTNNNKSDNDNNNNNNNNNNNVLKTLMDMKSPGKWYPLARTMKREIILHVGPTNSGKTYQAMERLKRAQSGVYCSPLRLLAWEISETLNKFGTKCDLVTGQELKRVENSEHIACTVEMVDVNKVVDCAVIDEIHLIGDDFRGYAFTRALLGTPALELHLCGDTSCVKLIEKICKDTGDTLRIRSYERLSPLTVATETFSKNLLEKHISKGDCFVAFSRKAVYALKNEIEKRVPFRACVIYGGLPPEARSRQAELFNKSDSGYDLLIASDAIGMGLNLNIRRVIFNELTKFDGEEMRQLTSSEVKQIAGRAGRYKMSYYDKGGGVVTTMDDVLTQKRRKTPHMMTKKKDDKVELLSSSSDATNGLEFLRSRLDAPVELIKTAGLAPTFEQITEYCAKVPGATLEDALRTLSSDAKVPKHYKMRKSDEVIRLAKFLAKLRMEIEDHYTFSISPTSGDCPHSMKTLMKFARAFMSTGHVSVNLIPKSTSKSSTNNVGTNREDAQTRMNKKSMQILGNLEQQHRAYDLYLWFARRMSAQFPENDLAEALRVMCAHSIDSELQKLSTRRSHLIKKAYNKIKGKGGVRGEKDDDDDNDDNDVLSVDDNVSFEELDGSILQSAMERVHNERQKVRKQEQQQRQQQTNNNNNNSNSNNINNTRVVVAEL